MDKWEYKFTDEDVAVDILNQLGAEGWELVAVTGERYLNRRMIFKRPQPEPGRPRFLAGEYGNDESPESFPNTTIK